MKGRCARRGWWAGGWGWEAADLQFCVDLINRETRVISSGPPTPARPRRRRRPRKPQARLTNRELSVGTRALPSAHTPAHARLFSRSGHSKILKQSPRRLVRTPIVWTCGYPTTDPLVLLVTLSGGCSAPQHHWWPPTPHRERWFRASSAQADCTNPLTHACVAPGIAPRLGRVSLKAHRLAGSVLRPLPALCL